MSNILATVVSFVILNVILVTILTASIAPIGFWILPLFGFQALSWLQVFGAAVLVAIVRFILK